MISRNSFHSGAALACLAISSLSSAATTTREEKQGEDRLLVVENDQARIIVFPGAGGAISEYLDKRTGIDHVAGKVVKGEGILGWKDFTRSHPNNPLKNWFGSKPYTAEFKNGDTYKAIVATCEADGLRVEREMRLANDSAELTVLNKLSNTSQQPRGGWLRWHPYMKLDDVQALSSSILVPGPGEHQIRSIPVGAGWDNHFMEAPGYWLAVNHKTGNGLWSTFRKDQAVV